MTTHYQLKNYPHMMYITNTDWHAIERDNRWELYDNDTLVAYADNDAIAQAKLLDAFEDMYGVPIDSV